MSKLKRMLLLGSDGGATPTPKPNYEKYGVRVGYIQNTSEDSYIELLTCINYETDIVECDFELLSIFNTYAGLFADTYSQIRCDVTFSSSLFYLRNGTSQATLSMNVFQPLSIKLDYPNVQSYVNGELVATGERFPNNTNHFPLLLFARKGSSGFRDVASMGLFKLSKYDILNRLNLIPIKLTTQVTDLGGRVHEIGDYILFDELNDRILPHYGGWTGEGDLRRVAVQRQTKYKGDVPND